MPEEAPAVQNWRLLIVACLLGLVVMVVYNIHIGKVRRGLDVEMVTAYRYARNLEVGDKVADEDLDRIQIARKTADSIGRLLEKNEKDTLAINQTINRDVSKSDFAMTGHFTTQDAHDPAGLMGKDKVQITIAVDSKKARRERSCKACWAPGERSCHACWALSWCPLTLLLRRCQAPGRVLRIGNHVNIMGILPDKSGNYQTYRIIEWLKVTAIGGQTDRGGSMTTAEGGVRNYKSITVEMKRKDPDVAVQWRNLETHLRGSAVIEICPSRQIPKKGVAGVIPPGLVQFTTRAAIVSDGGLGDDSY